MTVVVATLGSEAKSILPTFRIEGDVRRAVVFYYYADEAPKIKRAVKEISASLAGLGVPLELRKLADGYDYAKTTQEIYSAALAASKTDKVVFDLTGGTKVMAFAGFTAAWLMNARVVYNDERAAVGEERIELPVAGLSMSRGASPTRSRILEKLSHRGPLTLDELSLDAKRARSVIVYHLNNLEAADLIRRVRMSGNRLSYRITAAGALACAIGAPIDQVRRKSA